MKKTRNGMRITGLLLTMVMLVALLGAFSMTASAAEGTAIDLSSLTETYVISNSGEYIFIGSGCYGIKVASGNPTIVLNNANITVGEGSAIDVASGSNATIFVLGDNTIGTIDSWNDVPSGGIFVAEGGTVNITSNGTDNILRAHGTHAAAIGGKYIDGSESYNAGSISISNVTVYAYTNNFYAAAIGAAGRGSCGTINITNAVVYAYGAGDRYTSTPGIGSAWDHMGWAETIPVVIISGSEIHTFRYNPYSDYIGYLGDEMGEEGGFYATGSINCGEGGLVKSSTIYCYTGLDAITTDKTVKYGALGGLLKEDGTCEGEHSGGTQTCMGYKCANCANWYGEKNDTHDWSGKVGICANGCGMTCDHSNATYPADGITDTQHKLVCSECGYEVTETHDFVNGECVCSLKNFHIYGQQLNIGGDLSMKYYVTAFGDGVSTETLKMKFIFLGRETVVSGIYNAEMGMYVFTLEGINPQCMGDKIDAYLLLGDEEKASKLSYTVEENLLALRKEYEDDEALVTLVNDILAYGTAASEYKDHNSMTDVYVGSDREIRETEWPALDIGFEGYTVVFGQVNYLKIKVNLAEGQTLYLDGVNVTAKVVDGIFKTDGIAPTNFDKKFNFEIRTDGVLFNAFSVSVDDYLSAKRESETMGKLVKALYNYGVSAKEYAIPSLDLSQYENGSVVDITENVLIVGDGNEYNVSLNIAENVTVTFDAGTSGVKLTAPITVADGKTLTLIIAGDAEHTVNGGISLGNASNVIIEGDLTKENNKLTVTATDGNAGIGANNGVTAGDITIRNSRVDATGSGSSDGSGAAIGTSNASMGNILIENSIVTAAGGYYNSDDFMEISHAAAIGMGYYGGTMGNITLKDSEITASNNGDGLASVIGAGSQNKEGDNNAGTLGDIIITNTNLNLSMVIGNKICYAAIIGPGMGYSFAWTNMGKIIFTDMTQEQLDEIIPTWLPSDFNEWGAYALDRGYDGSAYKKETFGGVWVSDGNGDTVQIGNENGYYCLNPAVQ